MMEGSDKVDWNDANNIQSNGSDDGRFRHGSNDANNIESSGGDDGSFRHG